VRLLYTSYIPAAFPETSGAAPATDPQPFTTGPARDRARVVPEAPPRPLPRVLRPPSGWTVEPFCKLDEAAPGFLRQVTSSRPKWRHAVAMAVANGLLDRPDRFLERAFGEEPGGLPWSDVTSRTAKSLLVMSPAAIIGASFGSCPDGLVGALRKLGFDPLTLEAFLALHAVFQDPSFAPQRKALTQLAHLDEGYFEAIMILDRAVLSPVVVRRVRDGRGAERLNALLASLRRFCSTATDAALTKSIKDLQPDTSTAEWARSWLARADQNVPAPPWSGGDGLVALTSGELLAMAGRSTRTCIRSRVSTMLAGRAAYYLEPNAGVIACVVRTTTGWLTTQVVGTANGEVLPRVRGAVLDVLEANGVPCFRPVPEDAADVGLRAYSPWHLGEFELDDLEGLDGQPL
jgi:hypothetical protein